MIVVFTTSLRAGQETFFISSLTSCQNWRTFPTMPGSRPANNCSFFSSDIDEAPSRVLDVAMIFTSSQTFSMKGDFPIPVHFLSRFLAGVPGFEPGLSVLETDVLTVDTIPLGERGRVVR